MNTTDTTTPSAPSEPTASSLPTPAPLVTAPVPETAPAAESDLIDIEYFSKVKLRIAKIESVEAVPKSKKLLKLQVDLGPTLGKRQILSGISQFHTPESLVGRKIVVIANLKPAKLMGLESQGMLLAASTDDDSVLALLQPAIDIPEGSTVR